MFYKTVIQSHQIILLIIAMAVAAIALHLIAKVIFGTEYFGGELGAYVMKCGVFLLCGWALMHGLDKAYSRFDPQHMRYTEQLLPYNPFDPDQEPAEKGYYDAEGNRISRDTGIRLFLETHDVVCDADGNVLGVYEKGAAPGYGLDGGYNPPQPADEPQPWEVQPDPDADLIETPPDPNAGWTETPTESPYLLPDSNWRLLTEADLQSLSHEQLCLARNEIFARHGRIFQTPALRDYFSSQSWYDGRYSEVELSEIEKQNVDFIRAYEDMYYNGSYY